MKHVASLSRFKESGLRSSSSTSFLFYCTAIPRYEKAGQSSLQCTWKMRLLRLGYMERFTNKKKGGRIDLERCSDWVLSSQYFLYLSTENPAGVGI